MPYIGNNHIAGDHTNNFKVLDDISSYTATFNGSASSVVDTTNNTIRVVEHRFIQGQRVTYTNGGGGNIGGLTTGTAYFIIHDSASTFKLATSASNAASSTAINLSAVGTGSSHTLNAAFDGVNTKFKLTHSSGTGARLNNATQVNVAINNVLQKPNQSVSYTEGFIIEDNHKIAFKTAPTSEDIFWGSIIANTLTTFDISDHKIDTFTGDGSTTEFTLSHTPANNESLMVTINGVLQHPSNASTARAYSLIASIIEFTAAPGVGDEIQVRHMGFAGATTSDVTGFYGRTGNVVLGSTDHITTGDITARNINASGILTASSASFGGNVSIGGTLTYEDVSNIDSVGIITARDGIDCNGDLDVDGHTNLDNVSIAGVTTFASGNVQLASDSQKLQLGSGQDLWMYHTGTSGGGHGLIQNDYGTMYMLSDNFTFRDRSTNHDVFKINENNAVSLYYQNSAKLSTTSIGAQIDTILRLYGAAGTGGGRLRLAEGAAYSEIRGVRNTDTSSELWFGTEISDTVDYRAKINTGGHFIPGTDSTYDLGLTGTRWRNLYADTLYGDGSNLTGIAADKIFEGNTEVETVDTGSNGHVKITTEGTERLRITSTGTLEVKGTRAGSLQANDDDTLQLYTKSTSADIDRGAGITFYTHDGSGYEMGGTIQVAKQTAGANNPASYMRFSTQSGSTTTERLRITSGGQVRLGNTDLTTSASADDLIVGTTSGNRGLTIFSGTSNTGNIYFGDTNTSGTGNRMGTISYYHDGNYMRFSTNGNQERFRIDSSGNILTSGNTQLFGSNTSDGSDNKAIMINGGGAVSDSRGGYLLVHGNEHSSNPGVTRLHSGNVGTAYLAFNTSGNERLRITSTGTVLKGLTTARENYSNNTSGVEYGFQIEATNATKSSLSLIRSSNDANDGGIFIGKTRSTSVGGNTVVQAGDDLGTITFGGADGTSLLFGAEILAEVQSGVGNDDMPTDLIFKTNGGSTSTVERVRIDSDGNLHLKGTNHATRYYRDAGDRYGSIFYDGGHFVIRQPNGDNLDIQKFDGTVLHRFNTTGSLSVGHDSPDRTLHVKSGANNNNGAFRIESAPGNIMDMGTDSSMHFLNCVNNDPFRIKFAGNEALRLTQETSGNWTTSLQFYMETNNSQGATPYIKGVAGTEAGGADSNNDGGLEFHTKTGGSGTDINAMRINANGRVAIGAHNIQNPTAALHIIGDTSGSNTALQVGQDSGARYFRVNEVNGQSNFLECLLSYYDNTLAHVLKLQNTFAGAPNFGTAIQFIGHGGTQTGRIAVKNRDVNSASNSIMELQASYVTKPSHPCFDANRTAGAVSSTSVIVYNVATTNNGNHYSTSNGRFTAPVDGMYQFWWGAIKNNTSGVVRLHMRKNGSTSNMNDGRQLRIDDGAGQYGENGAITLIASLNANDYVQVVVTAGTAYGTGSDYTYFCGTLIG